mgnify:CR=1 FL=1
MAIQTIATTLTDKSMAKSVLQSASFLAAAFDAHLDALCLGIDHSQLGFYDAGASAEILQEAIEHAGAQARIIETIAKQDLARAGIRWSTDTAVSQMMDLSRHVSQHARFSDLVVLPKPYGPDRGSELEPVVEAALFQGRTPVLILPDLSAQIEALPNKALLSWNDSPESLAAIKGALPLLKQVSKVHIAIIDPPVHGPHRSDPGGMLATWLARHGVRAEIDVLAKTLPRVADVILRHAEDTSADMIVMGGYGHSRFREAILGGATRDMLEDAQIPVLMAH